MSPETAQAALEAIGVSCRLEDIRLELHGDRWFAFLPGDRLAVFPASAPAALGVARERAVLQALEQRCSFGVPRILAVAPDGSCDLRAMVPGVHEPYSVYDRVRASAPVANRVGRDLGVMIAELHSRVRSSDIAVELPSFPDWPESRGWIRDRLPHVIDDSMLERAADDIMARFEDADPAGPLADRVLAHTDLGLHNISIDSNTLEVHGIFDWEHACWSDRHCDFRHLVLAADSHPLLDAAAATYEERTGVQISFPRVFLHNAAISVSYLAFRAGHAAEERWCGRTLEEDLQWTRAAIARVVG